MALEREAKFEVAIDLPLPDLGSEIGLAVHPAGEELLRATYYDTRGMDLARWGVTLRHRGGATGTGKWTVKLPSDGHQDPDLLSRTEIDFSGPPGAVPEEIDGFLRDFTRNRRLREICRLTTTRRKFNLDHSGGGDRFGELDDDLVDFETAGGATGTFRELEVELADGSDAHLVAAITKAMEASGARPGNPEPKVLRALGWRPTDAAPRSLKRGSTVGELTSYAIAASLRRFLDNSPLLRTTEAPEPVHQCRVAARRLRSDLVTLHDHIKRKPLRKINAGLRDMGRVLGGLRDLDVMEQRLEKSISNLSDAEKSEASAYLERLRAERGRRRAAVLDYLNSDEHLATIDRLTKAIDKPPVSGGELPAKRVMTSLVRRRWEDLDRRVKRLGESPSVRKLHLVRIDAKRCRYASELAAPVVGQDASRLADALAKVQTVLGDLHDAVVLEGWLRETREGLAPELAGVGSALIEQERRRAGSERGAWKDRWQEIADNRLADWLD